MNIRLSSLRPARDQLGVSPRSLPLYPFIPAQRSPGTPGAASAFLIVLLIWVINSYGFIACLADVTD